MKRIFPATLLVWLVFSCSSDDNEPMPSNPPGGDNTPTAGVVPCENGMAGDYPCDGYDLIGQIANTEFNASSGLDSWGWTDPTTGKEYALMGLDNGTAFVDISDEDNLVYLGKLPTATVSSNWRDIKVYQDHAFVVAEAPNHGIQVFDLTKLRDVTNPPVTFSADFNYNEFGNAHNIVINEQTGFAYAVGTDTFSGGGHFVNIQDPKNPVAANGYSAAGYTHDAQVVTYNGPDADYSGSEIFIGSNENNIVILDVSDKENPSQIASLQYGNRGYTHQGWFTEDQRYFILGDELDELSFGLNSRTLIFDLTDLDAPVLHHTYLGPSSAIDHNGYVKGDEFYLANYTAGMRVLDIADIEGKSIVETGFFDTFPSSNVTEFSGAWNVYPYFDSGKIVISDINRGLFVVRKSQ